MKQLLNEATVKGKRAALVRLFVSFPSIVSRRGEDVIF